MSTWKKHHRNYAYLFQLVFFGRFVFVCFFGLPLEGLGCELSEVSLGQSRLVQGTYFELEEGFCEWVSAA